jgi:hypothetical protein
MDHSRWHRQRKALAPAFGPVVVNAQFSSLKRHLFVSRRAATTSKADTDQK